MTPRTEEYPSDEDDDEAIEKPHNPVIAADVYDPRTGLDPFALLEPEPEH